MTTTLRTLGASLMAAAGLAAAPHTWQIDSTHSSAQFSVRHMMVSNVRGEFGKVTGTVVYDPDNLAASRLTASIDVNSVDTREPKRDAHLKSADFFDLAKYPAITFESREFTRAGGRLQVRGVLTMHGVSREVVLEVEGPSPEIQDPYGLVRTGATATTRLNRKDWGLTWNRALEAGGVVVGDEVAVTLDVEYTRKPAESGAAATGR